MSLHFKMVAGDDKLLHIYAKTTELEVIPLTSISAITWEVINYKGITIIAKSLASGVTIENGAAGLFSVDLEGVDTSAFVGIYKQRIKITTTGGDLLTLRSNNELEAGTITIVA